MSEPNATATSIEEVAPGIYHWTVEDDRIHNRSDSYAVETPEGTVLVDPLPLEENLFETMKSVVAICLTGRFHQRAAWRYQKKFDVPVFAPSKGKGYEGKPDHLYVADELLPAGLKVVHAPGPTDAHYNFYLERNATTVMFIADLLIRRNSDDLFRFVPDQFMDTPDLARKSVHNLLNYNIDILCPNHGAYQKGSVHEVIREALEADQTR